MDDRLWVETEGWREEALALPGCAVEAIRAWVAVEMWCECGARWAAAVPMTAFRLRCPGCGAWGDVPVWGDGEDVEVEVLPGRRLN